MMRASIFLPLSAMALMTGCQTVDEAASERVAQATLRLANGAPGGTALLIATGTGVDVTIAATGISPGIHAVRLHMTGSCVAPDFASAGDRLVDLPDLTAGSAGSGTVSATLPGSRGDVLTRIFDTDGTTVVVHAGPEDNSPARIACGVFTRL